MKTFAKIWLIIGLLAIAFGAVIVIVVAASGAKWRRVNTHSFRETYENVESLNFDFAYGRVTIKEGDRFSIYAENVPEDIFKSYVSNGVWYINEKYGKKNVLGFNIFDISIFGFRINDANREITITLPRGYTLKECSLDIGAGEVEADAIYAKEGYFQVGAGKLQIDRLEISERSDYNVGAGSMSIRSLTANNTKIVCGVGEVIITGRLTGNNEIKCGVGQIKLDLRGDERDYSYELKSGLGSVIIDSHSYHNVSKRIDNNADNLLVLECGIGSIDVDFH